MKQCNALIIMLCLAGAPLSLYSRGFGSSFGGGFLGGFSGSIIGNAVSQPRRSECVYQQPAQTRVVEVHRPTYIEVQGSPTKAKKKYKRRVREQEDIIREQRLKEVQEKAEARTAALQQKQENKIAAEQVEQKIKNLALKEKEIELKKAEAELAQKNAENEQLKLELKRLQKVQ